MARSFSLLFFLLFSLFFVALTSSELHSGGSDDDIIIRQVVPELGDVEGGEEENLLTADHHHFSIFKRRFGKSYASQEEHDYRFKVFKANLRRARRHQQLDPSATHGVTQFSDLTPAEFRGTYLGLRPLKLPHDAQKAPILPTNDLPEDFDWRDHGAVTAVKNQVFFFCESALLKTFSLQNKFYFFLINFCACNFWNLNLKLDNFFGELSISNHWLLLNMQYQVRFIVVCPVIRVRVGLAGLSVLLERWKVLTSLQLGTLLALASNSLWSVITRFDISLLLIYLEVYASGHLLVDVSICL